MESGHLPMQGKDMSTITKSAKNARRIIIPETVFPPAKDSICFFQNSFEVNTAAMAGSVTSDNSVDTKMSFAANSASAPYFLPASPRSSAPAWPSTAR